MKSLLASFGIAVCLLAPQASSATTVTVNSLIDTTDAQQLETWLGVGPQDFTRIFSGDAGIVSAADFHRAVDGAGPTFSIYQIRTANGAEMLMGGYTALDWGLTGTFYDSTAFIFNLTTNELQLQQDGSTESITSSRSRFATFGGSNSFDIFGGYGTLGTCNGVVRTANCDGYTLSRAYDHSQGQISVAGDSGTGGGNSGTAFNSFSILSLEVFTFAPSQQTQTVQTSRSTDGFAPIPLPAAGWLLFAAIGGLAAARGARRNRPSA